jgi:maltose alpha-D-glucosyltransferase / alpha-amylase
MTNTVWFKDGVFYEVHVKSFYDSNGDGIGDFAGLTAKLDYLYSLGVTCVWLLPFYPSPLLDDGYDIIDYYNVHPAYGTLDDFKTFMNEAHKRGIQVVADMVINHTSDQHPWFQEARRNPDSPYHDYYVWSDTPERYQEARIIFTDTERSNWEWDPEAKVYYWHRFFSHQPDLNLENEALRREIFSIVDFWLGMGLDGFRVDAVPYFFEADGTNSENLPATHRFIKSLRRYIDDKYPGCILLAEANQWPSEVVQYFGEGDEFHMAFNFPLMPRLFMAVRKADRTPIVSITAQMPDIPPNCQWCTFLRNHDELTLEMVTDEERDYMWNQYAKDSRMRLNLGIRRRLAPLLDNDRRAIELMNALLFSLPGTPIIYYGDEIGMGDNVNLGDRDGVRTPMQWNIDRNAGFSRAKPSELYAPIIVDPIYNYLSLNVEDQSSLPTSLLSWMRRIIKVYKQTLVFGRGAIDFLYPENTCVLAFVRSYEVQHSLCVFNLSSNAQHVELDLEMFRGFTPVEMLGGSRFPSIGDLCYQITLPAHSFFWFELEPPLNRLKDPTKQGIREN